MRLRLQLRPVLRRSSSPSGSLDPLASSSSLRCIANCSYFGSRRAGDGALFTERPRLYRRACNETMDFLISAPTLTAWLPCVHRLLSVGDGTNVPRRILKKYPFW